MSRRTPVSNDILAAARTRTINARERNRLRVEAARGSSAYCTRVSQHLLGRDVESWLPDGVSALQRARRRGVRTGVPAAEAGVVRVVGVARRVGDARIANAGLR